jgi:hypothetical protein
MQAGLLLLCFSLLFLPASLVAQTSLGGIRGLVQDSTGAVVPSQEIKLVNQDTNQSRTTASTEAGLYTFPSIPAGNYVIQVDRQGFKKFEGKLVLRVGQEATVDISLEAAGTAVTVEVVESTPVIETSSATLSDVKESDRIRTLPLNGRNIASLFSLTAGVSRTSGTQINGLQVGSIQFLADGVSIEDRYLGDFTRVSPSLEGVQEFRIEALNSTAEYSKPATVSYLTKSGTNLIHGSSFLTYRSNAFMARNPFSKSAQPPLQRREFGASVGGPVYIPKLYNGKNKTFFFFTYEGLRQPNSSYQIKGSPTDALRNGDFSNYIPDGASSVYTIYDPLTTRLDPATGLYIRDPFPGNIIPADRITNMAKKALSYYPLPNRAGAPISANLDVILPQSTVDNKYTAKVDHQIGSDTLSGTFTYTDEVRSSPKSGSPSQLIYFNNVTGRTLQGTFAETHLFGPTIINEFRLGATRPNSRRGPTIKDPAITTVLNLPNVTGDSGWPCLYPLGPVTYDSEFGGWPTGIFFDDDNPQTAPQLYVTLADNLSITHNSHSIKVGGLFRTQALNSNEVGQPRGCYSFGPEWTGLGDSNGNLIAGTGSGFASFLLGLDDVYGEIRTNKGFFYHRQKDFAVYFQDDWKVNSRLTLNLGLRYEYYTRYRDKRDQVSDYDPVTKSIVLSTPVEQSFGANAGAIKAYEDVGVVFKTTGDVGWPDHMLKPDRNDFAPHIGFAYSLDSNGRTVIRGGYGINYWTIPLITLQAPTRTNPPFDYRRHQINWPTDPLDMFKQKPQYAMGDGTPMFNDQLISLSPPVGISPFDPYMKDSMAQSWNLTIERQLFSKTGLRLSYVGTRGSNLQVSEPVNSAYPASLYPGVSTQNRRADPVYGAANTLKFLGISNSNQFQMEIRRNVSRGLTLQAFYVYNRSLNNSDVNGGGGGIPYQILGDRESGITSEADRVQLEYGNSSYYPRHQVTVNFLYDLPFGPGQRFGPNTNPVVSRIIGGWQVTSIVGIRSGMFFSPNRSQRWMRVGDGNLPADQRTLAQWFDTSAFVPGVNSSGGALDVYTEGRPGRNILVGPGFWNVDFSLYKNTRIKERLNLRISADAFNFFNHFNWGMPNITSGRITGTANDPRLFQFGARVEF